MFNSLAISMKYIILLNFLLLGANIGSKGVKFDWVPTWIGTTTTKKKVVYRRTNLSINSENSSVM